MRNRGISWIAVVVLSAAIGGITGGVIASLWHNETILRPAAAVVSPPPVASEPSEAFALADLYIRLRPSVVKVISVSTTSAAGAAGSGLVLDAQGHIVTNYHVIDGFDLLDVKLADDTDVTARVVGADPANDLAILQIEVAVDELQPVVLAAASQLRIGDTVIAIGNPFDLEATLTQGVVSGIGRVLGAGPSHPPRRLIQTDTAINPGNSGGGLFNLEGELVGITNAIQSAGGAGVFAGIGYAIPVSTLLRYEDAMLAGEIIVHGRLGASFQEVTPDIANSLGLEVRKGVLVETVEPASGAALAGLRGTTSAHTGDVIIGVDGYDVTDFEDLASYVEAKHPGERVQLEVVRDDSNIGLSVALDAWLP